MKPIGVALLLLLLGLNIWATSSALRNRSFSDGRRLFLVVLTWLVPVVGALLTLYSRGHTVADTRSHARPEPQYSGETRYPGDTMAIDILAAGPIDSGTRPDLDRR